MEKLIELLNEYAHTYADHYDDTGEEIEIKFLEHTDNCFIYYCDGKFDGLVDDTVISKRFEFIKRLVDNDKIDIKTLVVKGEMRSRWDFDNKKLDKETGEESWNKYFSELCLMLLAIQENPIDFLCSILK